MFVIKLLLVAATRPFYDVINIALLCLIVQL